jgi:tetratricopeptide (TPR) repeat protein
VELSFRSGVLAQHFGEHEQAIAAYQCALQVQSPRHFSSVDSGIAGYKSRHNLALVYTECGRHDLAELQWRLALDEEPGYRQGYGGLGDALIKQNKLVTAELTAASMLQTSSRRVEGLLLMSDLARQAGEVDRAAELLQEASVERPDDPQLLHRRCWFYLEHEDLDKAADTLAQLCQKDPNNPSVYHNLGTVYYKQGRYRDAVTAYRRSLRLRPDSEQTQRQLEHALQEAGQDEAVEFAPAGTAITADHT